MTSTASTDAPRNHLHAQNQTQSVSQLPPVDEVCRILARVLTRVQASQQADATPLAGDVA